MSVKLLTEHHLEILCLKGGCTYTCQNTTLLEITCLGSNMYWKLDPNTKMQDGRFHLVYMDECCEYHHCKEGPL